MNKLQKLGGVVAAVAGSFLVAMSAFADYSTTTIASSFSDTLNGVVQSIIGVVITFFTNNLPLIVVLGVSIAMVFYFIHKAKRAGRGK